MAILSKPTRRILLSSTVAIITTILRHLAGDKNGIIPSSTSIKQIAVAISVSINGHPKIGTKKPGRPGFRILAKSPSMWQEFLH